MIDSWVHLGMGRGPGAGAGLGVGPETLRRKWLLQARVVPGRRSAPSNGELSEIKRLQTGNAVLRGANETLKATFNPAAHEEALGRRSQRSLVLQQPGGHPSMQGRRERRELAAGIHPVHRPPETVMHHHAFVQQKGPFSQ